MDVSLDLRKRDLPANAQCLVSELLISIPELPAFIFPLRKESSSQQLLQKKVAQPCVSHLRVATRTASDTTVTRRTPSRS